VKTAKPISADASLLLGHRDGLRHRLKFSKSQGGSWQNTLRRVRGASSGGVDIRLPDVPDLKVARVFRRPRGAIALGDFFQ
jgi:hypothetical protein